MAPTRGLTVLLALAVAACSSIGPNSVVRDRIDYATSIGNSWKEQTLLNLVKLRYGDVPIFLEVAQVIAGYQLQSTVGANFAAGNFTAGIVGPVTVVGNAQASGTYTDRPTVVYSPLTGVDFLKSLMTPIPPSAVLSVLQSGYDANQMMRITVSSINGLQNQSYTLRQPAEPEFLRLTQLLRDGQIEGALQIRIGRSRQGSESSVMIFGPSKDPKIAAQGREIRSLLGLRQDLHEIAVHYGGYSGRNDEIDMLTRSMLQIMQEFAAMVQVPESDVTEGRASSGLVHGEVGGAKGRPMIPMIRIRSAELPPNDAYAAVKYGGRWFWTSNSDIRSKSTFGILILLFSIAETGVKGAAPVVTIPANQ